MNNLETFMLIVLVLLVIFVVIPSLCRVEYGNNSGEHFTAMQNMNNNTQPAAPAQSPMASGIDPSASDDGLIVPQGDSKNFESLIYDNVTGTIMTGSQFMDNTGIVAPPWVAPAWNPDAYGPSSKGELDPADYENDPRMLYNKCSLSCCSPQYPSAFLGDSDPFVCDANGKNKYLASSYNCTNNAGGSGCLCMSPRQVAGMQNGWVDYSVDKEKLGY